jgi:WS/DGAT/MGAT family acyltransferase
MKQLSGMDNLFLTLDKGNAHMHVAGLGIYDPSTAPGGHVRFKSILKFFAGRLNQSKVFRRRLVTPPMGIDRPYWIEDPEIDLEYHIRHIALPHPGDWRQLCIQIARIHSRALDMSMPAWECYVIEGLDNIPGVPPGSFAMYSKFHHAAVDGEAGAELIKAIHSLSPLEDEQESDVTLYADREPTAVELYARAIGNKAGALIDTSRLALDLGQLGLKLGRKYLEDLQGEQKPPKDSGPSAVPGKAPITRFNGPVSPHRVIEAMGLPMNEIQQIRERLPGITVNDVFMSVTGGALRKYLQSKNELPSRSMSAMIPMTTRGDNKDAEAGNQVGMAAMLLQTDIEDPLERLHAVHRGSSKSKKAMSSVGKDLPGKLLNLLPAAAGKLLITRGFLPLINVVVSNVRGPNVPLYCAGAKLVLFMPVSIVMDQAGLNITGFSYNGVLWVCTVGCRVMMPDPAFFNQCLSESFSELLAATENIQPSSAQATPAPAARKAAAKPAKAQRAAPATKKPVGRMPAKVLPKAADKAVLKKVASKPAAKSAGPGKAKAARAEV